MAEQDLPAMVNYVINATNNRQIVYIGHSQGTLIGFAKFSSDLEFAKKVTRFVSSAFIHEVGSFCVFFEDKIVHSLCTSVYGWFHNEPVSLHSAVYLDLTSITISVENYFNVGVFLKYFEFGLTITGDQSFGDVKKFFRMIGRGFQAFTNDQCHNPFFYFSGPGSDATINKVCINTETVDFWCSTLFLI